MPVRKDKFRDKKNVKDVNENIQKNIFKTDENANKSEDCFLGCDIQEKMKNLEKPNVDVDNSSKTPISASTLAAMASAARQDKWIEYNIDQKRSTEEKDINTEKETVSDWLENNKPSKILRSSGVGWICLTVSAPASDPHEHAGELEEAWKSLTSEKDEISITDIRELATKFSVTGGKWLLHVNSSQVDKVWKLVATALGEGHLGLNVYRAKVSPVADVDDVNNEHVICVYNKDFTDEEEVLEVEASLRQALGSSLRQTSLRFTLQYKPQIFSVLGVYRNNSWGLRPSIYQSQYEMNEERPVIQSILEKAWFWNNTQGFGNSEECKELVERREMGMDRSKKDDRMLQRPCNFYNDVGMCEFKSGHLSKSGFTERMHVCRYCFNVKGRNQDHSEMRCLEKPRDEQQESSRNNPIGGNSGLDVGKKGTGIGNARPCDHFNDVGSCKFVSGHLSQSGFTRRLHICRLCFSVDGEEKNHPEGKCDRKRRIANTDNLLSVINSLNQLRTAESRTRFEEKSYNSRGLSALVSNEENGKDKNNFGNRNVGRPINGKENAGTRRNGGKENNKPFQTNGGKSKGDLKANYDNPNLIPLGRNRSTETQEVGGGNNKVRGKFGISNGMLDHSEKRSIKKLDQSTPRSRLYQNVSYGKEKEFPKDGGKANQNDQKEVKMLNKGKQDDKSKRGDIKEENIKRNEPWGSKSQSNQTKREDDFGDKKGNDGYVDTDIHKSPSKKSHKQEKVGTPKGDKLSKSKKNKQDVKLTVNTVSESCDISDVKMMIGKGNFNIKKKETVMKKQGNANIQSEESTTSKLKEKRNVPNIEAEEKLIEKEKQEQRNLTPNRKINTKSGPSKYGNPYSINKRGFQTPPRFANKKVPNHDNGYSEKFQKPPSFEEKKFADKKVPNYDNGYSEKSQKPPSFEEKFPDKKVPNHDNVYGEKFQKPPSFEEKKFTDKKVPNHDNGYGEKFQKPPSFEEKKFAEKKVPNHDNGYGEKFQKPPSFEEKKFAEKKVPNHENGYGEKFQKPPSFAENKSANAQIVAEKNFQNFETFLEKTFPNPQTLVEKTFTSPLTSAEKKFPNTPTYVEKKFPNPPTIVEKKFPNPPTIVEKKFQDAPRFVERKYPIAPKFSQKLPNAPKISEKATRDPPNLEEKRIHNQTDYKEKKMVNYPTHNFAVKPSQRGVSSVKKEGREKKPLHCPCPPYCATCLTTIKNAK